MEEMLGNVAGARQIFERWMEWQPDEQAWYQYINMELRYNEVDRVRTSWKRMRVMIFSALPHRTAFLILLYAFPLSLHGPIRLLTGKKYL